MHVLLDISGADVVQRSGSVFTGRLRRDSDTSDFHEGECRGGADDLEEGAGDVPTVFGVYSDCDSADSCEALRTEVNLSY